MPSPLLPTTTTTAAAKESGTTKVDVAIAKETEGSVRPEGQAEEDTQYQETIDDDGFTEADTTPLTQETIDESTTPVSTERVQDVKDTEKPAAKQEIITDPGTETDQESKGKEEATETGEGSKDEEVKITPTSVKLTTPTEADPTNKIANTFEPKKENKGVLHTY